MLLTDEERLKFIAWLRQEISSSRALTEQMEKIGVPPELQSRLKAEMIACMVIAEKLEKSESQTIG